MFQSVWTFTFVIGVLLVFVFSYQGSIFYNIIGLVYEIVGFGLMMIGSKNKIRITSSDLKNDETIEIDFISKRRLWELGIVLVINGLFFQLFAIIRS